MEIIRLIIIKEIFKFPPQLDLCYKETFCLDSLKATQLLN